MAPQQQQKKGLFSGLMKGKDSMSGSSLTKDDSYIAFTPAAPAVAKKPVESAPVAAKTQQAPATHIVATSVRVSSSGNSSVLSAPAASTPAAVKPAPMPAAVFSPAAAAPAVKPAAQPVPQVDGPALARLRADDARAAWQARPSIPVRLLDNYINFMVMGESGLGKTTFITNLVSSYRGNHNMPHDGSSTTLSAFQADPESLKTVLEPMEVNEAGRRLHVTVQDMPGWGDDINLVRYLRVVVDFILQQRQKDYELLAGSRGLNEAAMCGQLQSSITACIYFLSPHRVKKVDLIIMSALSQLVTVIPVIAKADTMTEKELAAYRAEVRAMLSAPSKYAPSKTLAPLDFNTFGFASQVLTDLGITPEAMPLALVTSNEHEPLFDPSLASELGLESAEMQQPVRNYRWGAAYALNREHSDLLTLKRLLLGDRVDSLYAMLDESYNRYLAFCEEFEANGKQLPLIVQNAAAMCTPYLEYDDYSNAKAALDSAQQAMSTLMAENKALMERINTMERSNNLSGLRN